MNFSWMAWTPQTAIFFIVIFLVLIGMSIWEYFSPGGNPRKGILNLHTTRGDRLFISLLLSAFLHLFWLFFSDDFLWVATIICLSIAIYIFRKV